jgi:hypothetical protein
MPAAATDDKKKLYWGIGIVVAIVLAALAFFAMRKPTPAVKPKYVAPAPPAGAPAPKPKPAPAPTSTAAKTNTDPQSLPVDMTKSLSAGSTGNEVERLQDDLGELGQGIACDGTWGPETTACLTAQYLLWGANPPDSITLNDFEAMPGSMSVVDKISSFIGV